MAMKAPLSFHGTVLFRNSGQCIRRRYLRPSATTRYLSTSSPLRSGGANNSPLRTRANVRSREEDVAKSRRSVIMSAAGIAACAVAMYGVIKLDVFGLEQQQGGKTEEGKAGKNASAMKMDGPDGFTSNPSVIRIQGQEGVEQVPTGTSSVPQFPTTIRLPKHQGSSTPSNIQSGDEVVGAEEEEYQLLGLGIRTVSFLRIQVYVVGLYVAKPDIVELQQRLVRVAVNPPTDKQVISNPVGATSATSLVSTERQQLKELLLDEEKGEDVWNAILKDDGLRTAFRIVPTRNTDFLHLRDGWVRGITARAQKANLKAKAAAQAGKTAAPGEYQDESFGSAMNDFKGLFGGGQRKNVPKGQTLVLMRSAHGELDALFQPDAAKPFRFMGRVSDERIGRLVWLNYLAGKNVSSEDARRSVVDGVMGIVERPIGTIVQKIV
ncbi:chalcone isomerase domain-containing protein [Aspergillus puulaauensis]|uniref:Altered inheritance of mitochondria protein 18 mitochondrial n=1 Tax=Aspergillus puulaauensis TaxID=1220207 RepID=A0A7R7XTD8_9EURO|nr:altered inheritance of mitochondria protein 18 mitochondrial [Aspergillus puulaauensis]BCS27380.1 altered inheritance of mitochondria protein 18 mitochondrial [Aspergillus puulaauensis]